MRRFFRCCVGVCFFFSLAALDSSAQTQLASLHPNPGLVWQRTSPSPQHPDGPVLYQLLLNADGTPGTVAIFGTNPRHLGNSPITVNGGNVFFGGANGLAINGGSGIITFAGGQTFPGASGGVRGIGTGNSFITIGGTAANPTVGFNTVSGDGRYLTLNGGTLTGNLNLTSATFTGNITGNNASYTGVTITGNLNGNTASFTGNGSFGGGLTPAGGLLLPAAQNATINGGFKSGMLDLTASSFNGAAGAPVNQRFRWQAEPINNNTAAASGTLNLLFSAGANPLAETGLSVASNGVISFAPAQTFPGASGGTVTQVNTGAGLAGGPITGTGTISANLVHDATLSGTGGSVALGLNTANTDARYLKLSGGTLTGNLNGTAATFTGNISGNNASFTGGGTFTGNLNGNTASFTGNITGNNASFTGGTFTGNLNGTAATFTGNITGNNASFTGGGTFTGNLNGNTASFTGNTFTGGLFTGAGGMLLPATGTAAVGSGGFNSNVLDLTASSFNATTGLPEKQTFRWRSEFLGNNSGAPSASLNLLYSGTSNAFSPAETGLVIASNGRITFAPGQTFPGSVSSVTAANGTIAISGTGGAPTVSVGAINGANINGGQVVKSLNGQTDAVTLLGNNGLLINPGAGTLTVTSNATPNIVPSAIVSRDPNGSFSAVNLTLAGALNLSNTTSPTVGVITLGGIPFLNGLADNAFVGQFAGNQNMSGDLNAGFGAQALQSNSTGANNSAFGVFSLQSNSSGHDNSAFGENALVLNLTGSLNSAFGSGALQDNKVDGNSAFGNQALQSNTTGGSNSAFGNQALQSNVDAGANSAFGNLALSKNNGCCNVAVGNVALQTNTSGFANVAIGEEAMVFNTTGIRNVALGDSALTNMNEGSDNIAVGFGAGNFFDTTESNNIDIGNGGTTGESNTIRIGNGSHAQTFITGIFGKSIDAASGTPVSVDSTGHLGTVLSSRRYKQQIATMNSDSDVLLKLRPVAFYYKPEYDPSQTRQYGLIAEEVAQLAPGLVIFDKDGIPQTVRYNFVNAMLLSELQKQRRLIDVQQSQLTKQQKQFVAQQNENQKQLATIAQQQSEIQAMQAQLREVILRLAAVEKSTASATQLASAH